jgi:N-methylhydantoinase A/acetophenone carboxylase
MAYIIDIDTGGTFTDGFIANGNDVRTVKVPTTPHDLTVCFLECIKAAATAYDVAVEDMLFNTDIIRFSNTIGTNTIIQRNGAKIGLLVSSGFKHWRRAAAMDRKHRLLNLKWSQKLLSRLTTMALRHNRPKPRRYCNRPRP